MNRRWGRRDADPAQAPGVGGGVVPSPPPVPPPGPPLPEPPLLEPLELVPGDGVVVGVPVFVGGAVVPLADGFCVWCMGFAVGAGVPAGAPWRAGCVLPAACVSGVGVLGPERCELVAGGLTTPDVPLTLRCVVASSSVIATVAMAIVATTTAAIRPPCDRSGVPTNVCAGYPVSRGSAV